MAEKSPLFPLFVRPEPPAEAVRQRALDVDRHRFLDLLFDLMRQFPDEVHSLADRVERVLALLDRSARLQRGVWFPPAPHPTSLAAQPSGLIMHCSVCGERGHNAGNRRFHPRRRP